MTIKNTQRSVTWRFQSQDFRESSRVMTGMGQASTGKRREWHPIIMIMQPYVPICAKLRLILILGSMIPIETGHVSEKH